MLFNTQVNKKTNSDEIIIFMLFETGKKISKFSFQNFFQNCLRFFFGFGYSNFFLIFETLILWRYDSCRCLRTRWIVWRIEIKITIGMKKIRPIKHKLRKSMYLHMQNPTAFWKDVLLERPENFQYNFLAFNFD